MRKFEARLLRGMVERTVVVEDETLTGAYRKAEALAEEGEFVRGVSPIEGDPEEEAR